MRRSIACFVLCLVAFESQTRAENRTEVRETDGHLARFLAWFSGEYTNYEQTLEWEQKVKSGEADTRFTYVHVHHQFRRIQIPSLTGALFHVKQSSVASGRLFRERIYQITEDEESNQIRLRIYKGPGSEASINLNTIQAGQLEYLAGCDVLWRYRSETQVFLGQTGRDTCRIKSKRMKSALIINDQLSLYKDRLLINDVARTPQGKLVFGHPEQAPYDNRKVRYFDGWAAMKIGGEAAKGAETDWRLHRPMRFHDQGGQVSLVDATDTPMGYRVELAHLTRGGSNTSLIKLSVVHEKTNKTVAYAWSDPSSEIIGLNAGWIRVGVKLAKASPALAMAPSAPVPIAETLATYLEGHFSSEKQAATDKRFRHVVLSTCRVEIPALGKHVLYVEQALAKKPGAPYRQRLYRLKPLPDGRVESATFTLADPKPWRGTCVGKQPPVNENSAYEQKAGCELKLRWVDETFVGQTSGTECQTQWLGSTYATAEVRLGRNRMSALDRGYDQKGQQVWGSEDGPYRFERIKNAE